MKIQILFVYLQCKTFYKRAAVAHSKEFGLFLLSIFFTIYFGVVPPCMNTPIGYADWLCNGSCSPFISVLQREGQHRFLLPTSKCKTQMVTTTTSTAIRKRESLQKLQIHIASVQKEEQERFRKDFKRLPRKVQFLIIRMVKEYNYLQSNEMKEYANVFETIISWLDCYGIINFSAYKTCLFINQLYL